LFNQQPKKARTIPGELGGGPEQKLKPLNGT